MVTGESSWAGQYRKAVARAWYHAAFPSGAVRDLRRSGADRQFAFSYRDASHREPWTEIHGPYRRGTRYGYRTQVRLTSRRSTGSRSRGSILDHSTRSRGSYGSVCWWPLRVMFATSRKSLTRHQSCCQTSSVKTRTVAVWCAASRASRLARRSNWKSFLKCRRS